MTEAGQRARIDDEHFGDNIFNGNGGRIGALENVGRQLAGESADFFMVRTKIEQGASLGAGRDVGEDRDPGLFRGGNHAVQRHEDRHVAADPQRLNSSADQRPRRFHDTG